MDTTIRAEVVPHTFTCGAVTQVTSLWDHLLLEAQIAFLHSHGVKAAAVSHDNFQTLVFASDQPNSSHRTTTELLLQAGFPKDDLFVVEPRKPTFYSAALEIAPLEAARFEIEHGLRMLGWFKLNEDEDEKRWTYAPWMWELQGKKKTFSARLVMDKVNMGNPWCVDFVVVDAGLCRLSKPVECSTGEDNLRILVPAGIAVTTNGEQDKEEGEVIKDLNSLSFVLGHTPEKSEVVSFEGTSARVPSNLLLKSMLELPASSRAVHALENKVCELLATSLVLVLRKMSCTVTCRVSLPRCFFTSAKASTTMESQFDLPSFPNDLNALQQRVTALSKDLHDAVRPTPLPVSKPIRFFSPPHQVGKQCLPTVPRLAGSRSKLFQNTLQQQDVQEKKQVRVTHAPSQARTKSVNPPKLSASQSCVSKPSVSNNFEKMTTKALKEWLRARGAKVGGRKSDLVQRAQALAD